MSGWKKAWDLFSARVLFCGFGIGNSLLHASGVSFLGAVSWLVSTETTCGHAACRMHMLDFGSPFFCPSRVGRVALLGIK
jgi:hypothetical protein